MTITHLPIHVLQRRSNGWHDISVTVGGGGILPWRPVALSFDGTTYPSNPTDGSIDPLPEGTPRRLLIDFSTRLRTLAEARRN